jgi:nucleotide-binding universal stress UspA family protein
VDVTARVLDGPVAPALAEACAKERLDLLTLGSRRRGPTARVVLGSVSTSLLHDLPDCPLLVCPRGVTARARAGAMHVHEGVVAHSNP